MKKYFKKHTTFLKTVTHIQIFFIFILPIVLLMTGVILKSYRIFILLTMSVCIYGAMRHARWTKEDIGLNNNSFKKFLLPYSIATLLGCAALILYAKFLGNTPQANWWKTPHFWSIFIVVSFFQEFAYRSFLTVLLKRLFNNVYVQIFVNAILFMFLHVIYPDRLKMLPLAFLGGLFFSAIYIKYPNLILISIMHSVLNFTAVLFGFFVLATY